MKKIYVIFAWLISFNCTDLFSQAYFVNTIIQASNHNFIFDALCYSPGKIMAFTREVNTFNQFDFRLFDLEGNQLLKKTYSLFSDSLNSLCGANSANHTTLDNIKINYHAADSTYSVVGWCTGNYGTCNQVNNAILFKLNSTLDTLWHREYSALFNEIIFDNDSIVWGVDGSALVQLNLFSGDTSLCRWISSTNIPGPYNWSGTKGIGDTSVVVCGVKWYNGYNCGILYEVTRSGNIQWAKIYNDSINQEFLAIQKTKDSCYGVLSQRNQNSHLAHISLSKKDISGNFIWQKSYRFPGKMLDPTSLAVTNDNGYLIFMEATDTLNYLLSYPCLLKLDANGNIEWNKNFTGTSYACQATLLRGYELSPDNGFFVGGGNLVKLDSAGNGCFFFPLDSIIQSNLNSNTDTISLLCQSIPANWNWKYNLEINHFYPATLSDVIYKDSCDFTTTINENSFLQSSVISDQLFVYPSPAKDELTITSKQFGEKGAIRIYDLFGREIFQSAITNPKSAIKINVSHFSQGIYFVELQSGEKILRGKFLKE